MRSFDNHIHIVTHEIPWPADYGGVYDLFYTIKALSEQGIQIHLHCFSTHRKPQPMLDRYCRAVHYYPRTLHSGSLLTGTPYIVASRSDRSLLDRLQQDQHPILFEGIHTTFFWKTLAANTQRTLLVRFHNAEHVYYRALARLETNLLKKWYFQIEANRLARAELDIMARLPVLTVCEEDTDLFRHSGFPYRHLETVPICIPWQELSGKPGKGQFCLYHGNLSVNENEQAALWLLQHVFNDLKIPFVIAGKNPSKKLIREAHRHDHTCIVENPDEHEMHDLIQKAHINLLPSFNETGIKLKVLHALYAGRYCLVNKAACRGIDNAHNILRIYETAEELKKIVADLYTIPFSEEELMKRDYALQAQFNASTSAAAIIRHV